MSISLLLLLALKPELVVEKWLDISLTGIWKWISCRSLLDRDADAAVETRSWIGWNKFRQLAPLLTNNDISLIVRGRLYSSYVWSSMLHGSETWPVRKENEVAAQRAEIRMVRWMCGVKLQDRVPSKGLRETKIRWQFRYYSKLNRVDAMEEADKGWLMTTIGVSEWMFLLLPAHAGCPGQNPVNHKWFSL